jgi:hypothetical protein
MAKRRLYGRRAQELPKDARVAAAEVDDPYEAGARILVARSLRGDPLAAMLARRQVEPHQFEAARAWLQLYRVAEIGRIGSIDPEKIRVDGSAPRESADRRRFRAIAKLNQLRHELGAAGDAILRDVLVAGMSLRGIAAARGLNVHPGSNDLIYLGRRLREVLDTLAHEVGLA